MSEPQDDAEEEDEEPPVMSEPEKRWCLRQTETSRLTGEINGGSEERELGIDRSINSLSFVSLGTVAGRIVVGIHESGAMHAMWRWISSRRGDR